MKEWSSLTTKQQSKYEKKWNKVQDARYKAGQKPYGTKGAGAWLKAQGISGGGTGLASATQSLKKKQRKYGI
ncbi:MAG: hypothetical protein ACFE9S_07715 [Candidatus Hermodarchaeota archaeon]